MLQRTGGKLECSEVRVWLGPFGWKVRKKKGDECFLHYENFPSASGTNNMLHHGAPLKPANNNQFSIMHHRYVKRTQSTLDRTQDTGARKSNLGVQRDHGGAKPIELGDFV